ncbi:hypothetical protein PMAYCL1PPCAC_14684, partial [Pristionchus mayeri]
MSSILPHDNSMEVDHYNDVRKKIDLEGEQKILRESNEDAYLEKLLSKAESLQEKANAAYSNYKVEK